MTTKISVGSSHRPAKRSTAVWIVVTLPQLVGGVFMPKQQHITGFRFQPLKKTFVKQPTFPSIAEKNKCSKPPSKLIGATQLSNLQLTLLNALPSHERLPSQRPSPCEYGEDGIGMSISHGWSPSLTGVTRSFAQGYQFQVPGESFFHQRVSRLYPAVLAPTWVAILKWIDALVLCPCCSILKSLGDVMYLFFFLNYPCFVGHHWHFRAIPSHTHTHWLGWNSQDIPWFQHIPHFPSSIHLRVYIICKFTCIYALCMLTCAQLYYVFSSILSNIFTTIDHYWPLLIKIC